MILLSPYLLSIFIVNFIILILASVGLFWALKISLEFDINNTTETQYRLSTRGYLVGTIIMFILFVKLPMFLYFVWTMDSLSDIVPGAMCAAGIVSATEYGVPMLGLKILNLFLLSSWLLLNYLDSKSETLKYTKLKFTLFQPIFLFLVLEFILSLAHFSAISIDTPVACCSVIFSQNETSLPFYKTHVFILSLFGASFIAFLITSYFKEPISFFITTLVFILSSVYALIRFFSPYIYELPTHMCPFCMLQSDYYYVGYLIYLLIFLGVLGSYFALVLSLLKRDIPKKYFYLSLGANILLVIILSSYPIAYYFSNGVWL